MCNNSDHTNDIVFKRNGTDQGDRLNSILDPGNLKLHDFDIEDWFLFTYNFAKQVKFFETTNSKKASGDWQVIFDHFGFSQTDIPFRKDKTYATLKQSISEILRNIEFEGTLTPHMTLFICFLKLLELSKARFNLITKKHLDFFYKDILQIEKLPAKADQVYVIFELAKKSTEEQIAAQTQLDAGKDAQGNKLIYKTTEELIANKAQITALKSVYNDIKLGQIKVSQVANSLDGQGESLKEEYKYWLPFGYTSNEEKYTELKAARLGFAIASPLLQLKEGERNIDITITFNEVFDFTIEPFTEPITVNDLAENISIFCSGEKDWLGPFRISEAAATSGILGNQLRLVFQISKDTPSIVNYDQKKLGESFTDTDPIIRFLIHTEDKKGHYLFRNLVTKTISTLNIKVDVKDVKSLLLESDTGVLNVAKPFYPFTTQPTSGSVFLINYPEIFSKKWKNIDVKINWKNTPKSFKTHYKAYKTKYLDTTISQTLFLSGMFLEQVVEEVAVNQPEDPQPTVDAVVINTPPRSIPILNTKDSDLIVESDEYFKGTVSILNKENWESKSTNTVLFTLKDASYVTEFSLAGNSYDVDKSGPIRLTLNQSLLHSLYPKIYTLAIMSKNPETLIPNEAYTPFIETISLNYTAEETADFTHQTETEYQAERIKLFQEAPFGQSKEHSYLKNLARQKGVVDANAAITSRLVPDYCNGGEFYIGLEEAENLQQITLLIQLLEGSENPLAKSFVGREKIEWFILCDNHWKNIENEILGNSTDNFLKSGILKFAIPKQATKNNTLFPDNLIWVRAKMHKAYDAICKVIDIKTQVVTAEFFNNGNDLSHLEKGLPAETISKLITRITQVKSVEQPFNSFNGKALESDETYYKRVSERLRHKNRAITLWDYEHLILQEFPQVFRVKCLNHTNNETESFLSPGDVTLIVVPDIINKNVFDLYEPRVNTATLNKIRHYVSGLNSMHVEASVINPEYEKVIIKLNVKFYPEYDENFYKKQLNQDITKFLSPWAFDTTQDILFGIELHRSTIIDYIEKLYYVDYLAELEMAKLKDNTESENPSDPAYLATLEFLSVLSPSNPKRILVSVKNHIISTEIKTCKISNTQSEETCQY
ncbi:baseplate J/gp47 family protein [Flavobacterium collinsii]|uniref:Baseplate_J domain-containing protein n=1 Tax=Flavobacterium collinsii TaxID=1114861 RepID=A0A9W4TH89_9FLAO|nr:baseplate J/gp47 family protein [Flavobacterium collinsii]CAI2766912.1 Baseplate_J domain-containing protein [Flavobacterium collinsii]